MVVPARMEVVINGEKSLVVDSIIGSLEGSDVYELCFRTCVHVFHEPFHLRDHAYMILLEPHSK